MKLLYATALIPLLAACEGQMTSTGVSSVINTITPEEEAACVTAAAAEAGVPAALVTVAGARAETTGPALTMNANGQMVTCKLNAEGEVTSLTMS